jgi:hypothetical protein
MVPRFSLGKPASAGPLLRSEDGGPFTPAAPAAGHGPLLRQNDGRTPIIPAPEAAHEWLIEDGMNVPVLKPRSGHDE